VSKCGWSLTGTMKNRLGQGPRVFRIPFLHTKNISSTLYL
jgi:hypothetical protein